MKKVYTMLTLALLTAGAVNAQDAIYLNPSPVPIDAPVKLYVDITSDACACPELQDVDPDTNPLYIWTYNPSDARPDVNGMVLTNGDWTNSNDNLMMHRDPDNANLWYFDFLDLSLLQFYGVDQATAETNGLAFLLKEKNGAPADLPEQKSADMGLDLVFDATNGINDLDGNVASFEVYPNPAVDVIRVKMELIDANYSDISVRVLTIDGKTVLQNSSITGIENGIEVNVSDLASGLYMVQLVQGQKTISAKKIMVK